MTTTRTRHALTSLVCFLLAVPLWASETPETILIRRTMANDHSGHRRADAELVLSAYAPEFVALDGHGNADPRAWTVRYEGRDAFAQALAADLAAHRHETERSLSFIHVRGDYAMITTQDSGRVVERTSGAVRPVELRRFWILRKETDSWFVAAMVDDLGDSLQAVSGAGSIVPAISEALAAEARGWNDSSPGRVVGLFDERFVGFDAYATYKPETWKIIFGGTEEFDSFLEYRLGVTDYQVDRQVLSAHVGPQGQEAVAVTREDVRIAHAAGGVVHELERNVVWTLSRRSGSWRVTSMCYGIALAD